MVDRKPPRAVVVTSAGSEMTFGEFLKSEKVARGVNVTHLTRVAGLSRANYYHLEGDKQAPSLTTAVALLSALGLATRVPSPGDTDQDDDVQFTDGETEWALRIGWSSDDRERSRARAAAAGLTSAPGMAAAGLVPGGIPIAAGAALTLAAALHLRERGRQREREKGRGDSTESGPQPPPPRPTKAQLREDIQNALQGLTTSELEAVLELVDAVRQRPQSPTGQ